MTSVTASHDDDRNTFPVILRSALMEMLSEDVIVYEQSTDVTFISAEEVQKCRLQELYAQTLRSFQL